MELLYDTLKDRSKIEKCIKKYGYSAEHNFFYYQNEQSKTIRNVFFLFKDDMGILAQKSKSDVWYTISEVLAPEDKRLDVFFRFLNHIFNRECAKKVFVELHEDFRDKVVEKIKKSEKYRHHRPSYMLYWPIFHMDKWKGDKLRGKEWKKLRNIRNRVLRRHSIKFYDHTKFSKDQLKKVVKDWIDSRIGSEYADKQFYFNLIDNEFNGYDLVRILCVNKEPCCITAGWKIPNSKNYYSNLGILNYKYDGIGELSNLNDLKFLKKRGFKKVDFGGSDKPLLEFKKKFKPHEVYKTYYFSISKK